MMCALHSTGTTPAIRALIQWLLLSYKSLWSNCNVSVMGKGIFGHCSGPPTPAGIPPLSSEHRRQYPTPATTIVNHQQFVAYDTPPTDCSVFYFDHKNITHVNNINLSTFNTKARRISRWQKLSKCSPLPRRQPRTRNYPSHTPLMIISGGMGHIYNVVLANKGTRTPCCSTKLPTSDGRLTGHIIVSIHYLIISTALFPKYLVVE